MQIVINISEESYKNIKEQVDKRDYPDMRIGRAIADGVPLPKGHGRLGDLDALRDEVSSWGMNDYEPLDFVDAIDEADTIIEADKLCEVESEETNDNM